MKTTALKEQIDLDTMYEVANVKLGFKYWFSKLLEICLTIFNYENLPKSLPYREIEAQLLLSGHCVIFVKNSELVTTYTSLFGIDKYYQPNKLTYAQPSLGSGTLKIDSFDNVIIWNCSLKDNVQGVYFENSLRTFIARYARQLADIESTINIKAVNDRITSFPIAKNDKVATSVKKFFNSFKLGRHEIISDDKIIEAFTDIPITRNTGNDTILSYLETRDKILEQFYRDIGVKFRNEKKAQLNVDETKADEQLLLISLDDMLECRKKGIEELNNKFNLNVVVKLNPKFDRKNFVESMTVKE